MTTRTITKALIGFEDLLLGEGSVTQTRNGTEYSISKINADNLPYSGTTEGVDLITIKEKIDLFGIINGISGSYDFADSGGAIGDFILGSIPDNSAIVEAWYEILTAFTSGGNATIALSVAADGVNEILDPKAYNDSTWMTEGYHDTLIFPRAGNFTTKTTAKRNIIMSVADAALTAGKLYFWCRYLTSE